MAWDLATIATGVGLLGTVGGGAVAVVKWMRNRRRVEVLAHVGLGYPGGRPTFFVTVRNASPRPVEVWRVWLDGSPPVEVVNEQRPLPKRLDVDESWSTWLDFGRVPPDEKDGALARFAVRLTGSRCIFRSKEGRIGKDVPLEGVPPGGTR